jgi:hypothetical protein
MKFTNNPPAASDKWAVVRLKDGKAHTCAKRPWQTSVAWDASKYKVIPITEYKAHPLPLK